MKRWILLAAAGLVVTPAAAGTNRLALRQTVGTDDYLGTRASMRFGDRRYAEAAYSQYSSDFSGGTRRTGSVGAGLHGTRWRADALAGGSPTVDGYGRLFFFGDATRSFRRGRWQGEFGGTFGVIHHLRETSDTPRKTRRTSVGTAETNDVLQTDAGVLAGLARGDASLEVSIVRSFYDKSPEFSAFTPERSAFGRTSPSEPETYPRIRLGAALDLPGVYDVRPYLGASYTTYQTPTADSRGAFLGIAWIPGTWSVDLSYERFIPGAGRGSSAFTTLEIGKRFN